MYFWARPVRLSARPAEGVVYDLVVTLERSGFRLRVYKPPISVYRKQSQGFLQPRAHFSVTLDLVRLVASRIISVAEIILDFRSILMHASPPQIPKS